MRKTRSPLDKYKKYIGQKFNMLTILDVKRINNETWVDVRCDCSKIKTTRIYGILYGDIKSCGCYNLSSFAIRVKKHGKSYTNLYKKIYKYER